MSEIPPPPPPPPPSMSAPTPMSSPGSNPKNWMGITALILGIVGLLVVCCWGFGFLPSAAALVLGLLGKKAADSGEANNRGMSQAGFILGIIGVVLNVLTFIFLVALSMAPSDWYY